MSRLSANYCIIVAFAFAALCHANPDPKPLSRGTTGNIQGRVIEIQGENDVEYNKFAYDVKESQPSGGVVRTVQNPSNNIKSYSHNVDNVERESSSGPTIANVMASADADQSGTTNADKYSAIAYNSREVRLVGPNQKEVEMDDTVKTKMIVAMDNLQKEATEVWGQVNEKLDKGWKDLKRSEAWNQAEKGWSDFTKLVEGVVSSSKKQIQNP